MQGIDQDLSSEDMQLIDRPTSTQNENSTELRPHTASESAQPERDKNLPIKRRLMVYTTRLEDMKAFTRLNCVQDLAAFYASILAESKPKFTADSLQRQMVQKSRLSFQKLAYKVDQANYFAKIIKLRSRPSQPTPLETEDPKKDTEMCSTKEHLSDHAKRRRRTVKTNHILSKNFVHPYRNSYLAFKNVKTNVSNIYFINKTGAITEHYINNDDADTFMKRHLQTYQMQYCCWYNYKIVLKNLFSSLTPVTIRYLSQPHTCFSLSSVGKCTCCCKKSVNNIEDSENSKDVCNSNNVTKSMSSEVNIGSEVIDSPIPNRVLIENMLNKPNPDASSLIKKAFAYTPPETHKSNKPISDLNFYRSRQILFRYNDGNEYYRLGLKGEICQHFRNVTQSFIEEHNVCSRYVIDKKVCCWFERDKLVNSFRRNNMLVGTWKYMKTLHMCGVNKCICCCKSEKLFTSIANLKAIELPNNPECTSEVYGNIPPLNFIFANHEQEEEGPTSSRSTHPPFETEDSSDPCSTNITGQGNLNVSKNETKRRELICAITKVYLESKIRKFNNISVYVTPMGKITAILNIPVTNLITDELKLLSVILNRAQKKLDNLRIKDTSCDTLLENCSSDLASTTTSTALNTISHEKSYENPERTSLYELFSRCSQRYNDNNSKSLKTFLRHRPRKIRPTTNTIANGCDENPCPKRVRKPKKSSVQTQASNKNTPNKQISTIDGNKSGPVKSTESHSQALLDIPCTKIGPEFFEKSPTMSITESKYGFNPREQVAYDFNSASSVENNNDENYTNITILLKEDTTEENYCILGI